MPTSLTQTEKLMIKYLRKTKNTSKEEAVQFCLLLPEEPEQLIFLKWLMKNLSANSSEILKQIVKIRTADLPAAPTE